MNTTWNENYQRQLRESSRPDLSHEVMWKLSQAEHPEVRESIAGRQDLLPELAMAMVMRKDEHDVLVTLALNSATPAAGLEVLSKNDEIDVREEVALNDNTSANVLRALANDDSLSVRLAVGKNINCPVDVMWMLFNAEKDNLTLRGLAANPSAPVELLEALHKRDPVGYCVDFFVNPSTPVSILREIVSSEVNSYIRETCIDRLLKEDPQFEGMPREWVAASLQK